MNLQENIQRIREMMDIVKEDEGDVDVSDFIIFKGTRKPLGANGIETKFVKELLYLMKTTFNSEPELVTAANEIESSNKISRKNRRPFRVGLYKAQNACHNDRNFNSERYDRFCSDILEVLVSDNDNRFSQSYGIMR